jgi:heme/copper-type cytochrome/quinol oxidase subunit 3
MLYKTFVKFSAKTTIKSHPFYIVKPSAYAIFVSIFAGLTATELVEYFHTGNTYQLYIVFFGFTGTLLLWFGSIMKESNNPDIYTVSVRENYIFGILLFIISEVMIFFAFFWTYLHSSLNPTFAIGSIWPPYNLFPMNTFRWPFFNTTLLLLSGVTVNVFYYTLKSQNIFKINKFDFKYMKSFFNQKMSKLNTNFSFSYEEKLPSFFINCLHSSSLKEMRFFFKVFSNISKTSKNFYNKVFVSTFIYEFLEWRLKLIYSSLIYTIFFGILFIYCQYYEYMHASFDITDGIYGSIFYTLTGLHGAHVIIGVILLIIVFFRLVFKQYNFTFSPHIGITAAVWYWHFVDLIWVFVYFIVYLWGNSL